MGCGQSKINIYPRKSKGKHSKKGSNGGGDGSGGNGCVRGDGEEEPRNSNGEDVGNDSDVTDDTCGTTAAGVPAKAKAKPPVVGGPLLAHTEISESQLNFFKMLDEKIENGPDYDSSSELEIIKENQRLNSLLHDWETASTTSRSLPNTPQRQRGNAAAHSAPPHMYGSPNSTPLRNSAPQAVHNLAYQPHSPSHQPIMNPHVQGYSKVMPGVQYQDVQNPALKQNYTVQQQNIRHAQKYGYVNSSPMGSPVHNVTTIPHIPQPNVFNLPPISNFTGNSQMYSNGELVLQQQIYNQHMQFQQVRDYQQSRELQTFKQSREQQLMMQQSYQQHKQPNRVNHNNYQPQYSTSVEIPIRTNNTNRHVPNPETMSPKMVYRKQNSRQYSQELT